MIELTKSVELCNHSYLRVGSYEESVWDKTGEDDYEYLGRREVAVCRCEICGEQKLHHHNVMK